MEFSAKREMKCCDWSIDDMREADCKNWRKSPKGFFDKLENRTENLGTVFTLPCE